MAKTKGSPESPITKALAEIDKMNENLDKLNFVYDPVAVSLDISGNENLENLYPIRSMRVYSLNISGCKNINTFHYLHELPLKSLYASNSSLNNRNFRGFENHVINKLDISFCNIGRLKISLLQFLIGAPLALY